MEAGRGAHFTQIRAFEIPIRGFGQVAAPDATISRFAELPGVLETLV